MRCRNLTQVCIDCEYGTKSTLFGDCCRLVYFIDDMNMPFVDKYDTQSAIELVRQMVDYRGW